MRFWSSRSICLCGVKVSGQFVLTNDQIFGARQGDARVDLRHVGLRTAHVAFPIATEPVLRLHEVLATRLAELRLEVLAALDRDAVRLRHGHAAEFQQVLEVTVANALSFGDGCVHQRLSERRLVAFVVTMAAVTVHVDHHVTQEHIAEIHGQAHDLRDGFRVFAVDVENRDLQHLRHVRGVGGGATLRGWRGETDLVVDHDVQRAAVV